MNKLKLLITASLLVGGGIFALSAADGVTSAKAAEETKSLNIDGKNVEFSIVSSDNIPNSSLGDGYYLLSYKDNFINGFNNSYFTTATFNETTTKYIELKYNDNMNGFSIQFENSYVYHGGSSSIKTADSLIENNKAYYWNFAFENNILRLYNLKDTSRFFKANNVKGSYRITTYTTSSTSQPDITIWKSVSNQESQMTGEEYFDSSTTSTSLKLSGYSNGVFNENIVFNNIDFGDDKQTKYSPNEMVEAMGLDSSAWSISGTGVELFMYNGYEGEIQFYENGYIEITNNESKINSFTFTDLSLTLSNDLIVVDENDNEVKGTENGNGTTFTFSGEGTNSFKITLTGRTSLWVTGSLKLYCKGSATITGAGIRFGTNIPVNLYDENAKYGVIVAYGESLLDTLDSYLGLESDISLDGFKKDLDTMGVKYYDSGKLIPAYVMNINDTEAATPEEANYVQYALVLNGLENLLNEEFAAVCYMTSSDGTFHIMSEARHSVRSVAEAYLADDKIMSSLTNNSIALLNAVVA